MSKIEIRDSVASDLTGIETLLSEAFPHEDLIPLVRSLLREETITLSLVATADRSLVGHAVFTECRVEGSAARSALLGPLAVAPAWQQQGIGSALVGAGLRRLEAGEVAQVFVLGDPAYYSRFGFRPEAQVTPPYPLPPEWRGAWQSVTLPGAEAPGHGELSVPHPWRRPELWAP